FSSRRPHTRWPRDWSSDVCSSDLSVTISITPVNNAPILSAITQPGSVAELANASAQDLAPIVGTLPVSDLDVGDTLMASISGTRSEERRVGKEWRWRWGWKRTMK